MNKRTVALTTEQYKEIISTMKQGFTGCRPNPRAATALMLEANLGLRISDIVQLRLCDIVKDGNRYRLAIIEQKTGKARVFTVPLALYQFIRCYCLDNGIGSNDLIFPVTERSVQKHLKTVCDYLGFSGISTHSFRKYYANLSINDNAFSRLFTRFVSQKHPIEHGRVRLPGGGNPKNYIKGIRLKDGGQVK